MPPITYVNVRDVPASPTAPTAPTTVRRSLNSQSRRSSILQQARREARRAEEPRTQRQPTIGEPISVARYEEEPVVATPSQASPFDHVVQAELVPSNENALPVAIPITPTIAISREEREAIRRAEREAIRRAERERLARQETAQGEFDF